jgi:hypothetical protein
MNLFRFVNMAFTDVVDDKGKTTCFKEINVIADTEVSARQKAFRPKFDKDNLLSPDWALQNTFELNKDWQCA